MSIYVCDICGYTYDEDDEVVLFKDLFDDWKCPLCTAPKTCFSNKDNHSDLKLKETGDIHPSSCLYTCEICGYVYDEGEEDTPFLNLVEDWKCPICNASKDCFQKNEKEIDEQQNVKIIDTSGGDAIYTCEICGYVYDESKEATIFTALPKDWSCPICHTQKTNFKKAEAIILDDDLLVSKNYLRHDDSLESQMQMIHEMAIQNTSRIEAMRTRLQVPNFDDILLLGAQLGRFPLPDKAEITTTTIIGKSAKKPMILEHPVYVSHMSFGALSKEAKTALAMGSAAAKTAQCSGEGGILPEEFDNAYTYIFEYVPNKYSVDDTYLQNVDAIEIKIGQGSKPGMGGHLPGEKVTPEIAEIRNKPLGQDVISPSRFEEIKTKDDLKDMVDMLRERSGGCPIGIKIAAGHIEEDLDWIRYANPDFITVDGRGGATGASPKYLKDNSTVPTVYALARTRAFMDAHHMTQELIITGGFRTSGEMIKALAMGADAIAIASAAMMAIGCQQYRVCNNGRCPMGIATQDIELRKRFDIAKGAKRLENYLHVLLVELKSFARISGHENIHDLSLDDICTINEEIAKYTRIRHC